MELKIMCQVSGVSDVKIAMNAGDAAREHQQNVLNHPLGTFSHFSILIFRASDAGTALPVTPSPSTHRCHRRPYFVLHQFIWK